jgi:hypothetical protein
MESRRLFKTLLMLIITALLVGLFIGAFMTMYLRHLRDTRMPDDVRPETPQHLMSCDYRATDDPEAAARVARMRFRTRVIYGVPTEDRR